MKVNTNSDFILTIFYFFLQFLQEPRGRSVILLQGTVLPAWKCHASVLVLAEQKWDATWREIWLTPPVKSNIDIQNSHVWKEIHFPRPIIFGINSLDFGGLYNVWERRAPSQHVGKSVGANINQHLLASNGLVVVGWTNPFWSICFGLSPLPGFQSPPIFRIGDFFPKPSFATSQHPGEGLSPQPPPKYAKPQIGFHFPKDFLGFSIKKIH